MDTAVRLVFTSSPMRPELESSEQTVVFPMTRTRQASVWGSRIPIVCWPLLATLIVQFHVLGNGFYFDDFDRLYSVSNRPFLEVIHDAWGGHLLHSFYAIVWTVKSLFGANPFAFLLLGLIVHLVSVWLLFGILVHLSVSDGIAAFGATLWGMSPFAAGALGWISVHGHAYATFAILWVLLDIVRCGQSPGLVRKGLLCRHALLLLVAATSFGTGLTSVVVLPLLVAVWNPVPAQRLRLLAVYSAVALATVALYVVTMQHQGGASDNLAHKADIFRQSLGNLPAISLAFAKLLAIGSSGLIWGPLMVGKIAVVPTESLSFVAGLATLLITLPLLIWGCIASSAAERRRIIALLLIPCAAYGIIAMARTGFFVVRVEAPKYHYLSLAVMAIVLCLVLCKLMVRLPAGAQVNGRVAYFSWLALVLVPFALGPTLPIRQGALDLQTRQFQESTQALARMLQQQAGNRVIYIQNTPFHTCAPGFCPPDHFPGLAALFVMSYPSNTVNGKPVYFLEDSEEIVKMAQAHKGTRIAELIIHPPTVKNP